MKALFLSASLMLLAGAAAARPPIAPQQALANVGQCVTVEGRAAISQDSSRLGVDIDLGEQDQNSTPIFTAFVPSPGGLPGLSGFDGQMVNITGVVQMDRGRPAILLANPEQIMAAGSDPGKLLTCDHD